MVIDDMGLDLNRKQKLQASLGFVTYDSQPWTGGIVPVDFSSEVSTENREMFLEQCAEWSKVAGVKCVPATGQEENFLQVQSEGNLCWADVGMGQSPSKRTFNFGSPWCWYNGGVLHDIGHVLGFLHEHQRFDRDQYLKINWENIKQEQVFAYVLLSKSQNIQPYDFMSIMHYHKRAYAFTGEAMEPWPAFSQFKDIMGATYTLSDGDKRSAVLVYGNP